MQRNWPVGPVDFDTLIDTKQFTNGADRDAVKKLFRKMSEQQLGGIEELDFDGMRPLTQETVRRLAGCLNLCVRLKQLDLQRTGLDDECSAALF